MGEMSELLTEGQYVIPTRALEQGFRFQFTNINDALKSIV